MYDRNKTLKGLLTNIIAVEGNPTEDIKKLRKVQFVMKNGDIIKNFLLITKN